MGVIFPPDIETYLFQEEYFAITLTVVVRNELSLFCWPE